MDVADEVWDDNLAKRNRAVADNTENFYYIDAGIAEKFSNLFEEPQPEEMDVWYLNTWK